MRIKTSELREVCLALLDFLETYPDDAESIELKADYYWFIPLHLKYDFTHIPEADKLVMGQLTDNWSELRKRIINGFPSPLVHYDFVWLAQILEYIGTGPYR